MNQLALRQKIAVIGATEEQKLAIETTNTNILVSASAGSGKTEVLTKRIISKILLKQSSIRNILAMTFTNAAAAEMKFRITKALQEELHKTALSEEDIQNKTFEVAEKINQLRVLAKDYQPLTDEEKKYLEDEIASLKTADITTIDSFCRSIVARFYTYIDDFDIERLNNLLSEDTKQTLIDNSIKQALNNTNIYGNYVDIKNMIIEAIKKLEIYVDPYAKIKEWKANSLNNQLHTIEPALLSFFIHRLNDVILPQLSKLKLQNIYHLLYEGKGYGTLGKNKAFKLAFKQYLKDLELTLETEVHTIDDILSLLNKIDETKIVEETDTVKDNIPDLNSFYLAHKMLVEYKKAINITQNQAYLYDVVAEAYSLFDKEKKQLKYIEYSDITRYAIEILQKNKEIAQQYYQHFNEILVDEYQDTNEIQDCLIRLISKNNQNIFRVGDVKQSIYKFRNADPSIMKNYYQKYECDSTLGKNIVLNQNFRSTQTIVNFNNAAYQLLMNPQGYPRAFEDKADKAFAFKKRDDSIVELCSYYQKNAKDKFITVRKKQLFEIMAANIKQLCSQGVINLSNTAILLRSNSSIQIMEEILKSFDIPTYTTLDSKLIDNPLIQLIIAVLKLSEDKHNDLHFSAVIMSSLFKEQPDMLASFKIDNPQQSLYSSLQQKDEQHPLFTMIRNVKNKETIEEKIQYILNWNVNPNSFFEQFASEQDQLALITLINYFKEYKYHSLKFALNEMDTIMLDTPNYYNRKDNRLLITTIHKSKGLEFDNVFIYLDDKSPINISDVEIDDRYGLEFVMFDEQENKHYNIRHCLIYDINKEKEVQETLRVLYVATTRAVNKLWMYASKQSVKEYNAFLLEDNTSSYMTYLMAIKNRVAFNFKEVNIDNEKVKPRTYTLNAKHKIEPIQRYTGSITVTPMINPHTLRNVKPLNLKGKDLFSYGTKIHQEIEYYGKHSDKRLSIITPEVAELFTNEYFNTLLQNEHYFEFPFHCLINGELQSGIIDFISIADTITIIDFKTDRYNFTTNEKLNEPSELINLYKDQLIMYYNAIKQYYVDKPINLQIYSTTFNQFIDIPLKTK